MMMVNKKGSGAFGDVYQDGNVAVKKFSKQEFLVQEIIMMEYLKDSPYIVNSRGFSLSKLEIRMDLYDMCLRDLIKRYPLENQHSRQIFKDILCGLSSMHSLDLIHSDIKHSNILVTVVPLRAVLCDLGISSLGKYARFLQTPIGYRRPDHLLGNHLGERHDLYGLSVVGLEMFGDVWLDKQVDPSRLQEIIQEKVVDSQIRTVLIEFSKMESDIYPSARSVLMKVYKQDCVLVPPVIRRSPMRIAPEDDKYIHDVMQSYTKQMGINMGKRGYNLITERFNNPSYPIVDRKEYTFFISCVFLILSAMFNNSEFTYREILMSTKNTKTVEDIDRVLTDIITKKELRDILMMAE